MNNTHCFENQNFHLKCVEEYIKTKSSVGKTAKRDSSITI